MTASAATSWGSTVREYRAVGSEIDTAASARPPAIRTVRPTAVTPVSVRPLLMEKRLQAR